MHNLYFFIFLFFTWIIVVVLPRFELYKPLIYTIFEVGVIVVALLLSWDLLFNSQLSFKQKLLIFIGVLIWIVFILSILKLKEKIRGVSILETLEISGIFFPLNVALYLFSTPSLLMGLVFWISYYEGGIKTELIISTISFSLGLLITMTSRLYKAFDNFGQLYHERLITNLLGVLFNLRDHAVIGGYSNLGERIVERLLQFKYLKPRAKALNSYDKFVWVYENGEFDIERFVPSIIIIDKDFEKWDYRMIHPLLNYVGLEHVSPVLGERVLVPLIGPDLKSEYVWGSLNLDEASLIVQTFESSEIENYLLQNNTRAVLAVRSYLSSGYVEMFQRDLDGMLFRFYPPLEVGTLITRRLYSIIAKIAQDKDRKFIIITVGNGKEVYYSIKAWFKLLNAFRPPENLHRPYFPVQIVDNDWIFLPNFLLITDTPLPSWKMISIEDIHLNQQHDDTILNKFLAKIVENCNNNEPYKRILSIKVWKQLALYPVPTRHYGEGTDDIIKPVVSIRWLPSDFQILEYLIQTLKEIEEDEKNTIVPVFIVFGKEGLSEIICVELFKLIQKYYPNSHEYFMIVPYYFRREYERLRESARLYKIDLSRIHLFNPYKTIREGVCNFGAI